MLSVQTIDSASVTAMISSTYVPEEQEHEPSGFWFTVVVLGENAVRTLKESVELIGKPDRVVVVVQRA